MFKIAINGAGYTNVISDLSLSTSEDNLAMQADFTIVYRNKELVKVGDVVKLYKGDNVFSTMKVIEVEKDGKKARKVTCFDYGFYLNENEVIIQFKNIPADQAIKQLCAKLNVKVRINVSIPYKIKKIYKGEKFSDILKDILDQCKQKSGVSYFFEVQDTTLVIAKIGDYTAKIPYNIILEPSVKESVASLKNQVVVVADGEDNMKTYITVKDAASIKKFGLLQKVEKVSDEEKAKAKKIAEEALKELNKVETSIKLKVLGNFDLNLRANRVIEINEKYTGMSGKYVIVSANHQPTHANNNRYIVDLEVKKR